MKKYLWFNLLPALLLALFSLQAQAAPTLVVLGDSLSAAYGMPKQQGWVALMEDRLRADERAWRVFNASISGETTSGGLRRLPGLLQKHQPELVIIQLGGNDGLRALSLASMRENLEKMIELSREAGARVLLVGVRIPSNYGPVYASSFHAVYTDLAESKDVALVESILEAVPLEQDYFQSDRLHPNTRAQPLILDTVWEAAREMLRKNAQQAAVTRR